MEVENLESLKIGLGEREVRHLKASRQDVHVFGGEMIESLLRGECYKYGHIVSIFPLWKFEIEGVNILEMDGTRGVEKLDHIIVGLKCHKVGKIMSLSYSTHQGHTFDVFKIAEDVVHSIIERLHLERSEVLSIVEEAPGWYRKPVDDPVLMEWDTLYQSIIMSLIARSEDFTRIVLKTEHSSFDIDFIKIVDYPIPQDFTYDFTKDQYNSFEELSRKITTPHVPKCADGMNAGRGDLNTVELMLEHLKGLEAGKHYRLVYDLFNRTVHLRGTIPFRLGLIETSMAGSLPPSGTKCVMISITTNVLRLRQDFQTRVLCLPVVDNKDLSSIFVIGIPMLIETPYLEELLKSGYIHILGMEDSHLYSNFFEFKWTLHDHFMKFDAIKNHEDCNLQFRAGGQTYDIKLRFGKFK